MTLSQCKVEGPSNMFVEVGAVSRFLEEFEGPLNACIVELEAVSGLSEEFDGPLKVCVVEIEVVLGFSEVFEGPPRGLKCSFHPIYCSSYLGSICKVYSY